MFSPRGRHPISALLRTAGLVHAAGLMRSSEEERQRQLAALQAFHERHKEAAPLALRRLQEVALSGGNVFAELMDTVKVASLGQITEALFAVGGRDRRSM